jgi:hypothetical protein
VPAEFQRGTVVALARPHSFHLLVPTLGSRRPPCHADDPSCLRAGGRRRSPDTRRRQRRQPARLSELERLPRDPVGNDDLPGGLLGTNQPSESLHTGRFLPQRRRLPERLRLQHGRGRPGRGRRPFLPTALHIKRRLQLLGSVPARRQVPGAVVRTVPFVPDLHAGGVRPQDLQAGLGLSRRLLCRQLLLCHARNLRWCLRVVPGGADEGLPLHSLVPAARSACGAAYGTR